MTVFAHISLCSFSGNAALLPCVHHALLIAWRVSWTHFSPQKPPLGVFMQRLPGQQGHKRPMASVPAGHGHARPKRWPPSGWSCRHCPAPENSCFLQIEFMFAPSIPLPFLPGNSHGPVDLVRVHEPARPLLPLPRTALCGVRGNGQARGHLAHVPGGQEIQRSCGAHRSSA